MILNRNTVFLAEQDLLTPLANAAEVVAQELTAALLAGSKE